LIDLGTLWVTSIIKFLHTPPDTAQNNFIFKLGKGTYVEKRGVQRKVSENEKGLNECLPKYLETFSENRKNPFRKVLGQADTSLK
jgi:hypothetical protein